MNVTNNVGYNIFGHAYFIEDGSETHNIISGNLGIGTKQIWTLIDTDVTAATFWATNPYNYVFNNRAGGGEWYAFWYELFSRPKGSSADPLICPEGMPLGSFTNNTAHSYLKFGLRIKVHAPRKYPCSPYRDDRLNNPWSKNPPIPVFYENFITWKNFENGVQGEFLGWTVFRNMKIADSKQGGIEIQRTNYSGYGTTKIENVLIVGFSKGNPGNESSIKDAAGIMTSHNENLMMDNIRFHNFGPNMPAFHSCSVCNHFKMTVSGAVTGYINNVKFYNVQKKVRWTSLKNEIYMDMDGSLTETGERKYISGFFPHMVNKDCHRDQTIKFNDSIICNSNVQIRRILFTGLSPFDLFKYKEIKVYIF